MVRASLYQVSEAAPWWTNIQQPFPFQVEARGLMVSALDSGSGGPGSSPGRGHCVVFLGKTLYSHSASTNGYQQMCHGLTSHPGGSSNTPCRFMLRKPENLPRLEHKIFAIGRPLLLFLYLLITFLYENLVEKLSMNIPTCKWWNY